MAEDVPINAKEALECIRSSMSNAELMERFKITTKGYADLLKQLFRKRLITEKDLARRGISFTYTPKSEEEAPASVPTPAPTPPVIAPPPPPEDEEFLDTAALTDLLAFKPPASPESDTFEAEEIASLDEEEQAARQRAKHRLADLFKKSG